MLEVKIGTDQSDIAAILPLARDFNKESGWNLTFNVDRAIESFARYMHHPFSEVLIVYDSDIAVGFAILATENEFYEENNGFISKFYISRPFRKTPASRMLLCACNAWFDALECKDVFASGTALIPSEGKMFDNLLKKYGFKACGSVLVRSA